MTSGIGALAWVDAICNHYKIMQINIECYYDCLGLVAKYSLEESLTKTKEICDHVYDSDESWLQYLEVIKSCECRQKIDKLSRTKWGVRQIYATLLLISGNEVNADLQMAAFKYESAKALEEILEYIGITPINIKEGEE